MAAFRWDGARVWLFDGRVMEFGLELDEDTEQVDFFAVGIARDLWDTPIGGAIVRDASASTATSGKDTPTDVVARFNPKGYACMTDSGSDADPGIGGDSKYPTFLDVEVCKTRSIGRVATLAMAARYLVFTNNLDENSVQNPDGSDLDNLLVSREPIPGSPYDPNDASTYTKADIVVPDLPITGRDMPTALRELIRPRGFDLTFRLTTGVAAGAPVTSLYPFLRQAGPVKHLYLPPSNTDLDPSYSNLASARIGRDLGDVVNAWTVQGALVRYEVTALLSPMFPQTSGDAAAANLPRYKKGSDYSKTNPDAYRLFAFDETGDGHYAPGDSAKLATPGSFGSLFGADAKVSVRRRPALEKLVTRVAGRELEPRLSYTTDYAGAAPPCLWDGTGTWQPIAGGYRVLKDRLGVRLTCNDPNAWQVGDSHDKGAPQKLNLVELLAGNKPIFLMLTCVIEADQVVAGRADRRSGNSPGRDPSPIPDEIRRIVDARERYRKDVVDFSSEYFANNTGNVTQAARSQVVQRDDTDRAKAEAIAYRSATEAGVLDGHVTVPYLTTYYRIGDRIDVIAGRGLDLRTDAAGPADTPVYPMVTSVRHELGGGQWTVLGLSDEGASRLSNGGARKPAGRRPLRIKGRGRNGERTLGR